MRCLCADAVRFLSRYTYRNPIMRLHYTERFRRSYQSAPRTIQQAFDRRAALLADNLRHPSLRAKKYDEAKDIWQARVTRDWRFYFRIEGGYLHTPRYHGASEVSILLL